MLRAVLCDDESLALHRLVDMLGRLPDIAVVALADNGQAALAAIVEHRPDVVFIDIEMPALDGFDVVEQLARDGVTAPLIVFVTAYPQFAAHAFDSGAIDFLTKPVRLGRLEKTLARVGRAIEDRTAQERLHEIAGQLEQLRDERETHAHRSRYLWVLRRGEMVRVDLDALLWVQAEGEYVRLHLAETNHLHREPIGTLLNRLDPTRYVRIHRSYIVDRDRVVAVRRRATGSYLVRIVSGEEFPVGRSYRAEARAMIAGAQQADG
ncbi:LytTR family DNA-binding domain-containing protein [Sphingomonas sp. SUN019]|uniref:LytR/AlgR family response regulator transcription factor n=1 Tax=Sphingomonas sp. SUN019 TaxID=2937788 RepID=UPI0021646393|nr:LytTR family DNA-binding domain-containing protein [Sphingomonas sp. SUN019]UVO50124.1 LytTR family DNA-binding domain-containing protein [Sphingomonas sp. SUN019]